MKNVSSLQVELMGMQQSRPSKALNLRDLDQTTFNQSELERENRLLLQRVAELEHLQLEKQKELKDLQTKHLETIEYFNHVVSEQTKRINQQAQVILRFQEFEQKVELCESENIKLQELALLYEGQIKFLEQENSAWRNKMHSSAMLETIKDSSQSTQYDGLISFSNRSAQ